MVLLLVSYFVFLLVFIVFSIAGIYHLRRFGYVGDLTQPIIIIYIIISIVVIVFTIIAMAFRSWPTTFA